MCLGTSLQIILSTEEIDLWDTILRQSLKDILEVGQAEWCMLLLVILTPRLRFPQGVLQLVFHVMQLWARIDSTVSLSVPTNLIVSIDFMEFECSL